MKDFFILNRFVFMALMEYCLVNIVLGDSYDTKNKTPSLIPTKSTKEKFFQMASRMSFRGVSNQVS
jgi:hypothetical protein